MLQFNPADLTERETYKLLIGTIIPRPIAFITTKSKDGIVNAAPFSYFNIAATNPPMLSVSIQRNNGEEKDTTKNIIETGEYVIHIVDEAYVHEMNKTAATLSAEENEIDLTNLTLVESKKVAVPAIKEAKVRFELTLEKRVELGPKDETSVDLLIGKIQLFHIAEKIYDAGKIKADELKAISRLAGHDYATIGEVTTIPRPK